MGRRRRGLAAVTLAAGMALAGCGDGDASPASVPSDSVDTVAAATTAVATTAAPTTVTPTTVPPTTLAPTTVAPTLAPTTTAAPTTTEVPTTTAPPLTAADLDLHVAAIGPVGFGTAADAAAAILQGVLGAPTSDVLAEYPTPFEGSWTDAEDGIFAFQYLRRICFANGLCTSFGAASPSALQLVGYEYVERDAPIDPILTTGSGVPLGARWSDYPTAMTAFAGGCYSDGYGDAEGVTLLLRSDGDPFLVVDPTTFDATPQVPAPSMVTVHGMISGSNPGFLYDDC